MAGIALLNGSVHTMDRRTPWVQAVAMSEGRIIAVGSNHEIWQRSENTWERIDLEGKTVLPGLTDTHVHFLSFGLGLNRIDLDGLTSLTECVERIRARVKETEPGTWIIGRGWNYNHWREGRCPNKKDLDPSAPDHPVVLSSKDGHLLWVNSRALERANITRDTPNPAGGQIQRDPSGDPTGLLKENALSLIWNSVPMPSVHQQRNALRRGMEIANHLGLTGVHVPEGKDSLVGFQALRDERALTLRVTMMPPLSALEALLEVGIQSGFGDERLRIGPVKLFVDGALGGQTAAMLEPYEQNPDNLGILTTTDEELRNTVYKASEAGINVAIHAIGDRANRMALDAIEAALEILRRRRLRPRIEHAQLLTPEDIERLGQLGVIASMQPSHATSDWIMADRHWGARCRGAYAWRSILNAGGLLCFGSDSPVEPLNPLKGIYAAVTRKDEHGRPREGWFPEQCLSVGEAVYAYTMGAAFASGEEHVGGSITPGKRADMVVLSEDLFADPPERILETSVEKTIVDGQIVFSTE